MADNFPIGKNTLRENDYFHKGKTEEKLILQELAQFRGKLKLDFMNEKTLRHFTFHSKNEIHILIEYVKNAGVKDGKKLSVSDKMMLYLMRLRINCPSKTLGFFSIFMNRQFKKFSPKLKPLSVIL